MSRSDTIAREKWRVRLSGGKKTLDALSCKDEQEARAIFQKGLDAWKDRIRSFPGPIIGIESIDLVVRRAGESRFTVIASLKI